MQGGQYQLATTDTKEILQCITNIVGGFMTVDPSILVSELAVVTMGGTTVASETTGIIPGGASTKT